MLNVSPRHASPLTACARLLVIASLVVGPLSAPARVMASPTSTATTQDSFFGGPSLSATKTDTLLVDNDGDSVADPGDVLRYAVVISNTGATEALGVVFSDTLDANTTLSGTVRASPLALNDAYTATQDTPLNVAAAGVLANDFGLPAPTAVPQVSAPTAQGGTVTLNADGSFTYTPPASFSGMDSFNYANTNSSGSDSASVTLNVLAPPTANDDGYNTLQNTPLSVPAGTGVLANDASNGGSITSYAATTTQGGSVTLNLDGSFGYTPTTGFFSPPADTFTYTVSNAVSSDTAIVSITVNLPAPPIAVDDVYTATANTVLNIPASGVLANDTVNGATISGYQASTPQGGTVTLNADGSFAYVPPADFISPPTDTFTYTLTNGLGSDSATVSLTVIPAGPPIAVDDTYTTTANSPLNVSTPGVLGNDTLNFGSITSYQSTTSQGGSVTLNLDGSFIYTPTLNFVSPPTDTFTYTLANGLGNSTATISITVNPPAPPIAADDTYTATANTPLNVSAPGVLGNDTTNFGTVTAYAATSTQGGTVSVNADGSFTYTPANNFISPPTDTFTYTLSNALGNSTATVSITVNPAGAPVAVDDAYTATVDTPLNVPAPGVLGNDTLNFGGIAAYAATTTRGGAVTLNADGSFTYTPPAGVISPPNDTFTYTLTNTVGSSTATVTLAINPAGPPVAVDDSYTTTADTPLNVAAPGVFGNDTLNFATLTSYQANTTQGGTVVLAPNGAFTYTPPAGTVSPPADTFTYTLSNALGDSTATVSITIDPPAPPLAVNDTYTATADTPLNVSAPGVVANDTPNFGSITNYQSTTARGGTVTLNADGSFTYTPPASTISPPTDSFTYTLSNVLGDSTATVTLAINPPGSPIAVNDTYTTNANTPLNVSAPGLLGNDTLNFGTITDYQSTTSRGGTVTLNGDGSFSYTPPSNVVSLPTDTFTYTLTNVLGSSTGTVNITINPPAPPIAVNDSYTTTANTEKVVAAPGVLGNDTVNFATITGYQATTARGGTVVLAPSGAFTYTPPSNVVSPPDDVFTYTLGNLLGSSTATVTITIDPPGPPIAVNDTYTATQNTQRTFAAPGLLSNDTTNFGSITNYQSTTSQGGTVVLAASGAFTYTPPAGFVSPPNDTFTYTLSNSLGNSTATVDITVYPPPPDAVNDAYNVTGNIQISVPAGGVLANDTLNTATLTGFGNTVGTANSVAPGGTVTTTNNGTVMLQSNGSFTYNPPPGFEGTDRFFYTLTNITAADVATVTLTISDVVWFVDNSGAAGDGRLGTPYNSLSSLQGADSDESGDVIFVYQGSGNYTGGLPLEAGQALIGQGVSLSGALTALGITIAPNSATLPGTGSNPTIVNAGGNALTLSTNNTVRGLNLGDASGMSLSGSSFGTLNADTVAITNTTGAAITLTTGTANVTFASVSSTGGLNGVNLNGITGTLTLGTGALSGATGATFNVVGGSATVTYGGNITQTNNAALVSIAGGHSTGTFTFQTGTLSASNGTGLQFDNADGTYNFNGTNTLNGGDAGIDILNGSGGTFSFSSNTSITNPSGTAFNLDASNANVTYSGSLSDNTGFLVDINNHDAGTVTFQTGSINSTASGVRVQNSGAGTVSFTNATKTLTTGTAAAVTLSSNTGSTVTFSGGGLVINTTSGAGFTATGGGTVNVTGSGNAITSTTGTALNIVNTTIGASGLTFQRISSNGGSNTGLILDTTGSSGGLTVTGTGSAGSGGTIANKTGADGSTTTGIGIYLNSTTNVSLTRMQLNDFQNFGIRGFNVNGFNLDSSTVNSTASGTSKNGNSAALDESSIYFGAENPGGINGLVGIVNITNCLIEDGFENNFKIANLSGTLSQFTMTGTTIRDTSTASPGNNGFEFRVQGTANITADITTSTFTGNRANGIQVTTTPDSTGTVDVEIGVAGTAGSGGTFTNNNIGVNIAHGGIGTMNFDVHRGTYNSSPGLASPININLAAGGGGPMSGSITSNAVTNANSGTGPGIRVTTNGTDGDGSNVLTIQISNNNISQIGNRGIEMIARDGNSDIIATVTNNSVTLTDPLAADGIRIDAGATSADTTSICATLSGNTSTTIAGFNGLRIRNRFAGTTFRLPSYGGTATDPDGTHDAVIAHLASINAATPVITADHAVGNSGFTPGGAACATPATIASPSQIPLITQPLAIILQAIGTLPEGKAVTLTFDVTLNNPLPSGTTQVSNQGAVSGSNFATILTDDPATGAANDPTITPVDAPTIFTLHLPLIARNFANGPDLVVQSLVVSGSNVQVVLKNQGTAPVVDEFWVDVYVAPNPVPTAVNQVWNDGRSSMGLVWGVTSAAFPSLAPGGVLTLTIGDAYYFPDYSNFTGPLPVGTPVYAQVDSAGTSYGAVLEGHESIGGVYNNIFGPATPTTAPMTVPELPIAQPPITDGLPTRPD